MAENKRHIQYKRRRRIGLKNRLAYMGIIPERYADIELGYSEIREIKKRFFRHKAGVFSLILISIVVLIGIFADIIVPYDPLYGTDYFNRYLPPVGMSWNVSGQPVYGIWEHPLGTDNLGRDILSRLIKGAQISVFVGFSSVAIGVSIGIVLGLFAGYIMGWVDTVIMRILDVLYAFPAVLLAAVLVAFLGPSLINVIFIIGITTVPGFTRIIRGSVLSEKTKDYVIAARSIGVNRLKIVFRQIFPNVLAPILILATLRIASAILTESTLSFLGLGPPAPTATWGSMLAMGRTSLTYYPTLSILPGIAIMVTVLGWNLAGDALRDAMDPTLREQ